MREVVGQQRQGLVPVGGRVRGGEVCARAPAARAARVLLHQAAPLTPRRKALCAQRAQLQPERLRRPRWTDITLFLIDRLLRIQS